MPHDSNQQGVHIDQASASATGQATYRGPYTEPVAGQSDVYDAEAARARAVLDRQQASVEYAIATDPADLAYVDDGVYDAGAPEIVCATAVNNTDA